MIRKSFFVFYFLILFSSYTYAQVEDEISYPARFNEALKNAFNGGKYLATLVIENRVDGEIYFLLQNGEKKSIGKVIAPAVKWSVNPFEASEWAPAGVCAVAVNAIHIKDIPSETGSSEQFRLLSILPREMLDVDPKVYPSYYQGSSSIYTDIPAGTGIFGGLYTPFLGCRVEKSGGDIPSEIRIEYVRPDPMPLWITFENRFGGMIKIKYPGQDEIPVGIVYRPVYGVGRFAGSLYCEIGRIRAVHTGVIDVSTSPLGEIGGFQIVPHFHADTSSVRNIRLLTQWMVIGPLDPTQHDYGRLVELFRTIQPRYVSLDENSLKSGISPVMSRIHVIGKFRSETLWRNFPSLVGKVDDALEPLEMIRIIFPDPETYDVAY